jgi:site-specific DNA recombinase
MKVAGYIRVSTDEQVKHGWNLAEDRELIRQRCPEGAELEYFDDGGLQGDDETRPALLAMLNRLDEFELIIMRSQDRISRDPVIWGTAAKGFRAAGVRIDTFSGPIDLGTPQGRFSASVMAAVGKLEKEQIGQRVQQALGARARAGLHTGGAAPYGYTWEDKLLVIVEREAEIIRRIFTDYLNGRSQRAIIRSLNDSGVPTRHGGDWHQSAVSRILGDDGIVYTGKLRYKEEVLDGRHDAIITEEVWQKAQAISSDGHRRKGGRHADGAHLLTRGILRCPECGSAMIPRKARPGVERERYVCHGRIAHPGSCSQRSIRRELIDEPFLAHLLDGYIDLEAALKRIEERTASALTLAREALTQAKAELQRAEVRVARVRRGWQDGVLDDDDYREQWPEVQAERDAALAALQRAEEHASQTEDTGIVGDAEQILLDHLAALKRAVATGADAAHDLAALRNVIGQMFESVSLTAWDEGIALAFGDGAGPSARPRVPVTGRGYWLLPKLRWSAVDADTFRPIGQEIPVPEWQSYPHGFLCRYCWW